MENKLQKKYLIVRRYRIKLLKENKMLKFLFRKMVVFSKRNQDSRGCPFEEKHLKLGRQF